MKPREFDYLPAATVDEALAALAESGGEAKILAGGQSLVAKLNYRLVEVKLLIDISRIPALSYIRRLGRTDTEAVEIGAATTQAELQSWDGLAGHVPLLHAALPHIGHFQTRNRGTVCGSLAHADPSSELPLCLAVLGGEVVLRSARGERTLAADEFQTGMLMTARRDDEMVVACTLRIDGKAVRSCLTFAVQVVGRRIDTVGGLADTEGELSELQKAFRKHHALQCGYCTPGILMSLTDYLEHNPKPTEDELRDMLSGHICRCTGYVGMVRAVLDYVSGSD